MPEVIFNGPVGRLEGRYHPGKGTKLPVAVILHHHVQSGGNMNHRIIYDLFYTFVGQNFSVLRFNFRGVGKSQGNFDNGVGELADAAAALDWVQTCNPDARGCWVVGFSFGAWIAMQLLMRRPEIESFISVALPANAYDFSFLAPCPSSGLIIHGGRDPVVPPSSVKDLVERLKNQRNVVIEHQVVPNANHFFERYTSDLQERIGEYVSRSMLREIVKHKLKHG